jgi:hypothetical protein
VIQRSRRPATRPARYTPRGAFDGLHIRHGGDPIPITVNVTWTDGTEGEVSAWTSQWTRMHVCVYRETAPPYHTFWIRAGDFRRREFTGERVDSTSSRGR